MRYVYWLRSSGMGEEDWVRMIYKGRCTREDEGAVGQDIKVRPARLGRGEYTCVVGWHDCLFIRPSGAGIMVED